MSIEKLKKRHRTLHLALAIGCSSSLQLAGCMNNPTRADLFSEASKATLRAEKDLGESGIAQASATTEADSESDGGRVVHAGGEIAQTDSPILRTGGEATPASKSSFWNFFKRKSAEPAVKDPFADSGKKLAEEPKMPAAPNASFASSPVPMFDAGKYDAQKRDIDERESSKASGTSWFEREFARQNAQPTAKPAEAKPAEAKVDSAVKTATAETKAEKKTTTASVTGQGKPFPGEEKISTVSHEPEPSSVPNWATLWEQEKAKAAADPKPVTAQQAAPAAARPQLSDNFWDSAPATTPPATTTPAVSASARTEPVEDLATRQQRMRMQALLSEAHSCAIRGEFHDAYRSALLAEKIANTHHLTFTSGEENPADFAQALAGKIWGTSSSPAAEQLAQTEALPQAFPTDSSSFPSMNPHQSLAEKQLTAPETSVFPGGSFATWQPLPEKVEQKFSLSPVSPSANSSNQVPQTKSAPSELAASVKTHAEAMPEIRPWPASKPAPLQPQPREFAESASPAPSINPLRPATPSKSESGVEFAIAHTVSNERGSQPVDPFAAQAPSANHDSAAPFGESGIPRQIAAAPLDRQRPMLMAPPIPVEDNALARGDHGAKWDELTAATDPAAEHHRIAKAKDSKFKWRLTWSILGLLGAGAATFIGLKISKMDPRDFRDYADDSSAGFRPQTDAAIENPAAEQSEEAVVETQEMQSLRIKRAA